jgi:TRAP-type C4-dicarboxylate transport system permease small subunit
MLWIALAVLVVLMMITVADVSGRYLFNHPITGTMELTENLMACLLVSMAPCALAGRHIKIDIFFSRLKPRVQQTIDIIFYIVGLAGVAFLTWTGFHQSLVMLDAGTSSSMLGIPDFPFIMLLVVSYGVLFIFMAVLLAKRIGEVPKK